MHHKFYVLFFLFLYLLPSASGLAQQPIPIIHPNTGGGGGVSDNVTIQGNGNVGTPFKIKAVQVDGSSITGTGAVGSPLIGHGGIGGGKQNTCGSDGWCNVVNFGADPTTVADSEPGFSAAQAAAIAAKTYAIYVPAGKYKLNFPFWIKGDSAGKMAVMGAGGFSQSSIIQSNYTEAAPYNQFAYDEGCGVGNMWTTPLVGSAGQSMCDNGHWFIDLKQLQINGSAQDIPLNGLSTLSVEFWFNANATHTGGNFILIGSGTDGSVAQTNGPVRLQYSWNGTTGTIAGVVDLTGGAATATTAALVLSGATHFYQLVYNGSNLQWYVDGSASGSSVAATGTVIDKPYFNLALGSGAAWPTRSAAGGLLGQVFGFRLSKTARASANPSSALTCDANTLVLLNGVNTNSDEGVASTSGPFVQPDCLGGSSSNSTKWYLMHNATVSSAISVTLTGLEFNVGGGAAGYGLVLNLANSSLLTDIFAFANGYVGVLTENNSYRTTFNTLRAYNNGLAGAMLLWPGELCIGCDLFTADYPIVDIGGDTYITTQATPASSSVACLVSLGVVSPNNIEELDSFTCDNENGGTLPIISTNTPAVHVVSSFNANGNPSTYQIADSVRLKIDSSHAAGSASSVVSVGFGLSSAPNSTVQIAGGENAFAPWIRNIGAVTDGKVGYEISGMGSTTVTGTTAGTAVLSCPTFTDTFKSCVVSLAGYKNATSTAQLIMMPAGITSMSVPIIASGSSCSGVSFGTGSNAGCVSSASPYPCCTGSGTGTCSGLQFVTLPANMSTPQTVTCQTIGS